MGLLDNLFGSNKKTTNAQQQTNPAPGNYPAPQNQQPVDYGVQPQPFDPNMGVDPAQFQNPQNFDPNLMPPLPLEQQPVQQLPQSVQDFAQPQIDNVQMPVMGSMPVMPPVSNEPVQQPEALPQMPDLGTTPTQTQDPAFNKDWYTNPNPDANLVSTQPAQETQPLLDFQNIQIPNLNLPTATPAPTVEEPVSVQPEPSAGDLLQTGVSEPASALSQPVTAPEPVSEPQLSIQPAELPVTTELDSGVKEVKIPETKLPPEMPSSSEVVEKEAQVVSAIESKKPTLDKSTLSIFQKIGIIGLNGPKVDMNKSTEIKDLSKKLSAMGAKLLFDSKNGLGASVLDGLKESNGSGMGIYFRPFMSNLFSKVDKDIEPSNIVSFIYSNFVERLQFLIKESRLFIIVDSGGIHNYSQFMMLWGMSYIYYGNHKPVVLYGSDWKDTIEKLKADMTLTQEEVDSIRIVETPDQLISYIKDLEQDYSNNPTSIEKVIDRRVEGDERDFLISK